MPYPVTAENTCSQPAVKHRRTSRKPPGVRDPPMLYAFAEMAYSIRRGLLSVAGLGALTCALSLYVLGRPIMMANANRVERSRDGVEQEVERLRSTPEGADTRPSSNMYGMRSGYIAAGQSFGDMRPPLPEGVPDALRDAVDEVSSSQGLAALDRSIGAPVVFVAAAATPEHRFAWAAYVMQPPRWTPIPRLVGLLIAVVSFALVLAACTPCSPYGEEPPRCRPRSRDWRPTCVRRSPGPL